MNTLPKEAINKIMMFLSHPVADITKQSDAFDNIKVKNDRYKIRQLLRVIQCGDPVVRGWSDGYMGRPYKPNMWVNVEDENEGIKETKDMTSEQIEAYELGFAGEHYEDELQFMTDGGR